MGRLLPPRPTSLFGRTHSRPSGWKVGEEGTSPMFLPHAVPWYTLVSRPSIVASFPGLARRCRSHSLIDRLRPPSTFSLNLFFASRRELQITKGAGASLYVCGGNYCYCQRQTHSALSFIFVLLNRREGPHSCVAFIAALAFVRPALQNSGLTLGSPCWMTM